jgi:hypothetical protein
MATLAEAIAKVRRLCNDPGGAEPTFEDELVMDGILEALKAILPWTAKEATYTYSGDGSTSSFAVPEECYEIQAIYSNLLDTFIPRVGLFPGAGWQNGESSTLDQNYFVEYPNDMISLSTPPGNSEDITIYYTKYWTEPEDSDEDLEPPPYAFAGILLFAASWILSTKATSAANIRQYGTKVDSGVPTQNPMLDMSKYYLQRFDMEMNRHPVTQRGQKTR